MDSYTSMEWRLRQTICSVTGHQPEDLDEGMFLEGDLGIDSIKMVELSQHLVQLVAESRRAQFMAQVPTEQLIQAQTIADLRGIFADWDDAPPAAPAAVSAAMPSPVPMQAPAPEPTHAHAPMPSPMPASAPVAVSSAAGAGDLELRLCTLISGVTGHQPGDLDAGMYLEGDLGIDSIKMVELSQHMIALVPETQRPRFLAEVPTERLMQSQTIGELMQLLAPWQDAAPVAAPAMQAAHAVPAQTFAAQAHAAPVQDESVEMLGAQYPFLVSHWAVSTCSLASRVRVQGAFDPAIARRAWNDLLARHPALRAHFVIPAGARTFSDYRFEVAARVDAPEVTVSELGHLDAMARDAFLSAEVARCVNHQWDLQQPLLHRFYAFRLGPDLHEVFFTNHHLISDGLGNQQVIREFLALYGAHAAGQPAMLPPATTLAQYRDTVAAINAWNDPAEDKALAELLRRQGKQAFVWSPNQAPRAADRANVLNHRFRLDADETRALLALTRDLRMSMNTMLVGAYLRTVAAATTQSPILLNIPTSGRVYPGVDASGVIGCFAQNLVLDFAAPSAGEDWGALLTRVHAEIESALSRGYDRAQTRQVAGMVRDRLQLENGRIPESHTGMIRAGMKSNLFLPYIGNTHLAETYGPLRLVDYQAATVTNAGTLDTVIELVHGRLEMTTNYDANHYDLGFVAQVAEAFLAQLRSLAAYRPAVVVAPVASAVAATPSLQAEQVRQVAEEIMHRPLSAADLARDLEADLGLDSLERIRIVTRLERFVPGLDRRALLACRRLDEMVALIAGGAAPAMPVAPTPVAAMPVATAPVASASVTSMPAAPLAALAVASQAGLDPDVERMPYRQIVAQCKRTPKAIAVASAQRTMTYEELDQESNRLAHLLRAQGVGRGSLVGMMLPRGPDLMIALLAILKAGGGYVPLDPDYPAARLAYMLEHARIDLLLTVQGVNAALGACLSPALPLRRLVYLDERPMQPPPGLIAFGRSEWMAQSTLDLAPVSQPDDTMVVLYTSGSTGRPKGVVLGHRGYINRHDWHQQLFRLQPGERVAQKTSICFDISVWELFWPLQFGGVVCPVETSVLRDPWALGQWIVDNRINVMHFVPSLFGEFLNAVEPQIIAFPALRQLVFSGEAMPVAHVRRWFARFGLGAKMANLYGPTEASIDVSAWQMSQMPPEDMVRVPIGHAMPNVHLVILDEHMRPVPRGEQGELWIGGVQLAHGYLHDPERTAESFRANPLAEIPCPILYRTGDLCVQLPDGSFDYRGRVDSQVKIRGYRVELGEIEATLCAHPSVREAAVLAIDHGDGHLRLSAWLSGEQVDARQLREFLGGRLPAYMLPQRFEWLSSLPKNQNGKLDRKALLSANGAPPAPGNVPDVSALEQQLVASGLDFPVGPAQHWLLNYFDSPYQWAGFSRFRYLQPLDMALFNRAIDALSRRHPALRSVFKRKGGVWYQHFPQPRTAPQAEYYDGTHLDPATRDEQLRALVAERVRNMQIDSGVPLWSVIVVKEAADRHDIWLVGHHIISDMLGNGVLFKDLWRIYSEYLAGREPDVAESTALVSYLESLQKQRTRESLARQVEYWTSRFPPNAPSFAVPFDHHGGENVEASSAGERFAFGAEDMAALQKARQQHGASLYTLLVAPLYRLLAEWSGNPQVVLSHRVHGRDLGEDNRYFDCVGNFAVNYPLGLRVDGAGADWASFVRTLGQAQDAVPLGGVSYDLVGDRLPEQVYPDHKLTMVRANYLGNRDIPPSRVFEFSVDDWDKRYALPQQKRTALIECFFIGGTGGMQLEIGYSTHFHQAATIRRVGDRYLALLREMLAQLSTQAPAATASPVVAPAIAASLPPTAATTAAPALVPLAAPGVPAATVAPAAVSAVAAPRPLEGKVAVVTGAGRGIGRHIAGKLAEQGAQVVLVSRTRSVLDEALAEVRTISPGHHAISADVTQQEDVEAMMREVAARFGGVDILINNAGANRSMLLAESDPKEWREIIDINLMATYLCCRSAVPLMLGRGGGKIVNIGSVASVIGYPLFSAYSASKHAVIGLTKALSEEVKQQNIQVNVVCPAFVDTRMTPQAFRSIAMPTDQVADVVLFLASPGASGITGESINIFGRQDMYAYGSDKLGVVKSMTRDFKPGVTA